MRRKLKKVELTIEEAMNALMVSGGVGLLFL
jgi:hypothetical protein